METLQLKVVNDALSQNRIDADTEPRFISGTEMLAMENSNTLDKSPEYQRPYTKLDGKPGYYGDEWQKALIVAFLTGKFIQPIHHRYNLVKKKWEIIDGGHRTRTILNFFKGLLKTPNGFSFEWKGGVYDLGGKTWDTIQFDHADLAKYLMDNNYFFVVRYSNMSDKEARAKFVTLNNLNIVTSAERRNAYNAEIAHLCRKLGAVDYSPYKIFNTFNGGKMEYVSMACIKRETDAFVTALIHQIYLGDTWREGDNNAWNTLYIQDERDSENGLSKFTLDGKYSKEAKTILKMLNDMVIEHTGIKGYGKNYWGVHRLLKYSMFFRWLLATYSKKKLSIDYKTFVTEFDKVVASIKEKHLEYQRYELVNGNVVVKNGTKNKDIDAIPYPATKVFSGGTRIDDYEFILLHVQAAFDLDKFGVSIGEVRGKFVEQDVWEVWAEQDYKCLGCDKEITRSEIEADHIVPVKGDGKTDKDNLQILCSDCNGDKSSGMNYDELVKALQNKSGRLSAEQIKKIGKVLSI